MPELLETIEAIDQESASVRNLFEGDGQAVRQAPTNPRREERLAEAVSFLADVYDGVRPMWQIREAMTTSDFPILFGDILDRQLLGAYTEIPASWSGYIRRGTVRDFRKATRLAVDGMEGPLSDVEELAPYEHGELSEAKDEIQVHKVGRKAAISLEALINDDLDAFRRLPDRLARAARRTEELEATKLFVGASGPQTDLYKSTPASRVNIITGNPALTAEALQAGLQAFAEMKDEDGQPIAIDGVHLVVPPALEVTANHIVNATELEFLEDGGNKRFRTANWVRNRVTVHVNHYIPFVASTANGATSWFLFADPNTARPAAELAFLAGYEAPGLFRLAQNAQLLSGGDREPVSFENDSVAYKVRHILGGARFVNTGGWRATVASNGTG